MPPAMEHVARDTFVFQQDNAPSHHARTPLNSYSKKCRTSLVLISGHQTAQTSPVDCKVWGVMQQRVYECRMNSVGELKLRLIDVWKSAAERYIDTAINEWRKQLRACAHADGQHFEHLLRAHVTNKSYGQIKYK